MSAFGGKRTCRDRGWRIGRVAKTQSSHKPSLRQAGAATRQHFVQRQAVVS